MKIILCDQDGVLTDKTYSCNYLFDGLNELLVKNNAILVPNSDTPTDRLRNNFEQLTGVKIKTLISERGAIVTYKANEYLTINLPKNELENYKQAVHNLALDFNAKVYFGDSATWVRNNEVFDSNKNVIIFDTLRKTSLGYYARRTNSKGLAIVDNTFYAEFTNEARKITRPKFLNTEDYNQSYGIVILSSSKANKTTGFNALLKLIGSRDNEYYMIGDSKTDIIQHPSIIHLAVNNCDESLREKANFISSLKFTKGMMECIEYALST